MNEFQNNSEDVQFTAPVGQAGMGLFSDLVIQLGSSTKTNDKINALVHYFSIAESLDKVWTIALFSDRKPKRPVNTTLLATWAIEYAALPWWLFEESYSGGVPVTTDAVCNNRR